MKSYVELRNWRDEKMKTVIHDHHQLNSFHDVLMTETIRLAKQKIISEWGNPPAHFDFFVMGSAGRFEQSIWSDQDHGIIFEGTDEFQPYFLKLGEEITRGFSIVGYDLCDGNVMASNPLWCQSVNSWKHQIICWLDDETWESLRYFSTFFDSRVLVGSGKYLQSLKKLAFTKLDDQPILYKRLLENVGHFKKGIGPFGQLLPKSTGLESGSINLKEMVLFPYVNSLRLLALKEKILLPSTLSRFQHLPSNYETIQKHELDFINLLNFRLSFQKYSEEYKNVHLLMIKLLTKDDKSQLKKIMNNGYKLLTEMKVIIEKGGSS